MPDRSMCCPDSYFCENHDFFFQDTLKNIKLKRTAFIWNRNLLFHYKCLFWPSEVFTSNRRTSSWLQIIGWQTIALKLHVLLWGDNKERIWALLTAGRSPFLLSFSFLEKQQLCFTVLHLILDPPSVVHVISKYLHCYYFPSACIRCSSVWVCFKTGSYSDCNKK